MRRSGMVMAVCLGFVDVAVADIVPTGGEFQVNQYTTHRQEAPVVVRLPGTGAFVVVFSSYGPDGDNDGIFARRYDGSATPLGSEFRVNTYTTGEQYHPAAAMAPDGRFVVVWPGPNAALPDDGIFGQRFDSAGAPAGTEFLLNSYTTARKQEPVVAMDDGGGFVAVWESQGQDGDDRGVFARRFGSNGSPAGTEFQVNGYTTDSQVRPRVAIDPHGGFLVVWDGPTAGGVREVFARRYDSLGGPTDTEFRVNTYTTGTQYQGAVAFDPTGRFVVVWSSYGQDGDKFGIFVQRFTSTGAPDGTEFRVNSYTPATQYYPAVAADEVGNFVVAWVSLMGQDGDQDGIFAQRYDSAGAPIGTNFQVNTYTTGRQGGGLPPTIGIDDDGDYVVLWQGEDGQDRDQSGIFGERYQDPCGDAVVGVGETCDTGKRVDRSCCSKTCQPLAGTACTAADGNRCGRCDATATCVVAPCGACAFCEPAVGCRTGPRPSCRRPTKARKAVLELVNRTRDKKDRLVYRWQRGSAGEADFGDPAAATDYTLCVFDKQGGSDRLVLDAAAPAGGTCRGRACWKRRKTGFAYRDRERTPDGIAALTLVTGTRKAQAVVEGRGVALALPPLGLAAPVTAQLQGGADACFGAEFATPATNTGTRFKAKGQ